MVTLMGHETKNAVFLAQKRLEPRPHRFPWGFNLKFSSSIMITILLYRIAPSAGMSVKL